mmetsp:Transcript_21973/g.35329  ORF Transcript_21973/g.35329 Transcript_21973/m.35329 type:complete len:203 (-) Transcript_21973:172-780(-)
MRLILEIRSFSSATNALMRSASTRCCSCSTRLCSSSNLRRSSSMYLWSIEGTSSMAIELSKMRCTVAVSISASGSPFCCDPSSTDSSMLSAELLHCTRCKDHLHQVFSYFKVMMLDSTAALSSSSKSSMFKGAGDFCIWLSAVSTTSCSSVISFSVSAATNASQSCMHRINSWKLEGNISTGNCSLFVDSETALLCSRTSAG